MPAGAKLPMQAFAGPQLGSRGMLRDIWETPKVLRALLKEHISTQGDQGSAPSVRLPALERPLPAAHSLSGRTPLEVMAACGQTGGQMQGSFTVVGSGSSHHVALVAEYLIEGIARIPVEVQYASEFRFRQPITRPGDVFVFVSNSGETEELVESLRLLNDCPGVLTLAVVNTPGSTVAVEADAALCAMAGEERGVVSTKGFSCAVGLFTLLAVALGEAAGTLPESERALLLRHMQELPDLVQRVIDRESRPLREEGALGGRLPVGECRLWDVSCQNVLTSNFIFLGRGFNFPVAMEGAYKCKEVAYIHAEGYPAAEMKHGPIALIDQFMPVVVIAPRADPTYEKIKANIEEVRARSGSIIAITEDGNTELEHLSECVIGIPQTHEYLMPLVTVIPLQLLAYMMGVLRGNEVDRPRGLRKSITGNLSPTASSPSRSPTKASERAFL